MQSGICRESPTGWVLRGLACLALSCLLTGCEWNDFINASEPKVLGKDSKPLVVPILDTLDPSVEEPDTAYSQAVDVRPQDLVPDISDYRMGKNDTVSVSIFDLYGEGTGEAVKLVRVSETGMVSLPFISPVKAEGLTERELEQVVSNAYQEARLIKNARVSATVAEARARTYSIQGNVGSVGEYQITRPDYRMLDVMVAAHAPAAAIGADYAYVIRKVSSETPAVPPVLPATQPSPNPSLPTTAPGELLAPQSRAGGPPERRAMLMDQPSPNNGGLLAPGSDEGASGVIEGQPAPAPARPASPGPAAAPTPEALPSPEPSTAFQFNSLKEPSDLRVIRVPIDQLRQYGQLKYNIVIRPGDMIIVPDPQTGFYYMAGHSARPGVFSLAGTKVTIKQAWGAAGGADDFGVPRRSEIIRRIGTNKEVFVRINISKIWAGQQPDIYLKPNDIVFVGTDFIAPFVAAVRNSFRFTYGFGFLYDRDFSPQSSGF